jgi:hypothetical protein
VDLITDFDAADSYLFQTGASLAYRATMGGAAIDATLPGGVFSVEVSGATAAQLQAQTLFF